MIQVSCGADGVFIVIVLWPFFSVHLMGSEKVSWRLTWTEIV